MSKNIALSLIGYNTLNTFNEAISNIWLIN